jgi:pimeloyl-ACP methyl ester carboxylesterase
MVRHSLEQADREAFGAYLTAWAKTDFSAEVKADAVPVKVIVGAHDPALGEATMRATWLQHHPGAELEVLPDAGHYAMYETPVRLVTVLEEFLSR